LVYKDIYSQGVNEIHVIPRDDNVNNSRAKAGVGRVIHVSKDLMKLYSNYLIEEYPEDIDSDYVFVNCWDGEIDEPLEYGATNDCSKGWLRRLVLKHHHI